HMTATPDLHGLAGAFVPIVDQALAKNPAKRFRTITEMARAVAATGPDGAVEPLRSTLPLPAPVATPAIPSAKPQAAVVPVRRQVGDFCASLVKAAFFAAVFALVGAMLLQLREGHDIAKAFFLTLACCWAVLIPAWLWRRSLEESWPRRATLLGLGLTIGLGAVWLDGYPLTAVWAGDARPDRKDGAAPGPPNPHIVPTWIKNAELPQAASYLAFFGLAFFATRWWKVIERQRPQRFRAGPVLAVAFW